MGIGEWRHRELPPRLPVVHHATVQEQDGLVGIEALAADGAGKDDVQEVSVLGTAATR